MDLRLFKWEQLSDISQSQTFACHVGPNTLIRKDWEMTVYGSLHCIFITCK